MMDVKSEAVAVRASELRKRFNGSTAVDGASFEVEEGGILALLGPSGCGKTTALRLVAGFETPDGGSIEVGGKVVAGRGKWTPPERRRVGMVFQDYALFPHMTVRRNVAFGLDGVRSRLPWRAAALGDGRQARRVDQVLEMVGLAHAGGKMPHELSGGEQQRVALARALAPNPPVALLDEPFSNLDAGLRVRVRSEVRDILREAGCAAVWVTHDQEEAFAAADRVGVMLAGRVRQIGPPAEVYASPQTLEVAAFLGDANIVEGEADGAFVTTALGRLPTRSPASGRVKAVVRPEAIRIEPKEAGLTPAHVAAREFYGHHQVVLLDGPGGMRLRARMGPAVPIVPGEDMSIAVTGIVAVFPDD